MPCPAKLKPTDDELRKFYADRPKLIAPQPLLTVRAVSFDNTQTSQIAAMKAAIDETNRRRAVQERYNADHNIEPMTIVKGRLCFTPMA